MMIRWCVTQDAKGVRKSTLQFSDDNGKTWQDVPYHYEIPKE